MEFSSTALTPAAAGFSSFYDSASVVDLSYCFIITCLLLSLTRAGCDLRTWAMFYLPPFFSEFSSLPEL